MRLFVVAGATLLGCGEDSVTRPDEPAPDAGAALVLSPASHEFGASDLTEIDPVARSFTLQNTSPGDVAIDGVAIAGAHAGDFSIPNNTCPPSLAAGASCGITVQFQATARDRREASLEITGSESATGGLAGDGTSPTALVIAPKGFHFGDLVAETSNTRTFTVFNELADTTITPALVDFGANAAGFTIASSTCIGVIPVRTTCTVDVTFTPAHGGEYVANLEVTGASVTVRAGVMGQSTFPIGAPFTRMFGSLLIGETGTDQTITIRNNNDPVTGATTGTLTPTLAGAAAADFTIRSNACTTLSPGQTCDVVVRMTPATRGAKIAQLVVTDGANSLATHATLRGDAYAVLVTGNATFPATPSGQTSAKQTYTLINASSSATGAISSTLLPNTSQFSIATNTCAAGIPANGSCEIELEFHPTSAGAKSATLSVSASPIGGSDTFDVSGNGT